MANAHDLLMAQRAAMMGKSGAPLPYIHFDGVSSFINLNYTFYINTVVECLINPITTGVASKCWFGGLSGNSYNVTSNLVLNLGGRRTGPGTPPIEPFKLETSNAFGRKVNGVQTFFNYGTQSTCSGLFYIGAYSNRGTAAGFSEMKLFYMKIFNGENLAYDLVPIKDGSDGCLKDVITGKVFRNEGGGSITYGELELP